MGIKLGINNEEKLEKNDTNQKEPVTDISTNEIRCTDNNASNTYKSDSSINSDVSDTLVEFKPPALYAHEELPDAIVIEPVASDINTAELALNISSSSKSVDNSKHNEDRPEEIMSKSEQDLEAIVKGKIDNWTLPDFCYICMINLMWPGRAEFHYNSDRHKHNIAVYRDGLLNYLKSQQTLKTIENGRYKAVEGKLYASEEKNNYGPDIVNINSNDCNTTEGENETTACYNSNEEEPVIDDLEAQKIKPDINNGEMLEKNDTKQKEPVIDISTNKFADNNARDIYKLHSYVDDTEDNSSINSVVSDTLPQSDANVGEINAAELALDIKNSSKTIDNSKYNQDRQEEIMPLSEQDLEAIIKKKLENLTLPHYCHICKTNLTTPVRATNHYKSRRHERHIATHRYKIFYELKSEQQEAVAGKSYSCLVCDIELNSKELYETHVESCIHESYASLVKSSNSHESIVNINSREGNDSLKSIDNSKFNQDRPEEDMRNSEQDLETTVKEKIDSLTLMDYCYICLVNLKSLVDAISHYNSEWHKCNIATYTDVLNNLKSEQDIEAIVNEKINNLTLPTYCHICKASLKLSHNAESHYKSERHVHGIRVYRDEILKNLISEQQELNSKELYETHVESCLHESYASLVKSSNSQETVVNINSQECSINKGKNETAACYNTNEKEPVVDDLETQEIRPVINNGGMLDKINTNQKEPYDSERHKCNFAVRGGEIANKLESTHATKLHKAVDRKSYYCHICNIRKSKMLYSDHVHSAVHQLYASLANTNFDHTRIVKVYSNDCNITKGANETTPCYNASEKEPVLDDLEKHEINPDINNGEMLEKVNTHQKEHTHQKEPVIDISTNEREFAVNSDVNDTFLQFKPALYTYEELLDAFVVEPETEVNNNTAESALNVSNSSRNIDNSNNSKYNQARQEEILELALEPTVKETIDKLTLPYYCHMCKANLTSQHNATAHYKSRKHRRLNGGYRKKILNDLKSKKEGLEDRSYCCLVCNEELNSKELYEIHVQSCVHEAYASLGKRNNRHKPIGNINSNDCNITEGENITAVCYNTDEKGPIDDLEKHEINCDINNGEMWEKINTNQKEPVMDISTKEEIRFAGNNPHDIYKLHSYYVDDPEDDSSVNSDVNDTFLQFKPALYTYEELSDAIVIERKAEVDNNTAELALNVSNSYNSKYNQVRQEEIISESKQDLAAIVKETIENLTRTDSACYNTNEKELVINDLEKNEIEIVVNNEEILEQNNEQLKNTFNEISDIENWIIDKHKNEIIAILKQKFTNCEKTECYKLQAEVFLHLKQIINKIYCTDSPPLIETLKVLESVHKNLHNPVQISEEKCTQLKTGKVSEVEPFKRQSTSRFGYVNLTVMATVTATVTACVWWLIKKRQ
ncbi:uncharacterized protein LOC115890396 [Sitophilus oryzae]|uniref:Uncharacterized protein LOC115890396 n=1 Tax=Sitophilus oryzae TaxID=7048 RepID=A0A6J2YT41_SITOR|nr:uncharacterized protein LOC115890396 [Sitophilus oryzae]